MIIFQKEIERDVILYFKDDSIYSMTIRLMQNTAADQTNNRTIQNDEIMEGKYFYSFRFIFAKSISSITYHSMNYVRIIKTSRIIFSERLCI